MAYRRYRAWDRRVADETPSSGPSTSEEHSECERKECRCGGHFMERSAAERKWHRVGKARRGDLPSAPRSLSTEPDDEDALSDATDPEMPELIPVENVPVTDVADFMQSEPNQTEPTQLPASVAPIPEEYDDEVPDWSSTDADNH